MLTPPTPPYNCEAALITFLHLHLQSLSQTQPCVHVTREKEERAGRTRQARCLLHYNICSSSTSRKPPHSPALTYERHSVSPLCANTNMTEQQHASTQAAARLPSYYMPGPNRTQRHSVLKPSLNRVFTNISSWIQIYLIRNLSLEHFQVVQLVGKKHSCPSL